MVSVGTVRSQTSALNRVSTELYRFCLYILVLTFLYKIRLRRVWMWDPLFFLGEKKNCRKGSRGKSQLARGCGQARTRSCRSPEPHWTRVCMLLGGNSCSVDFIYNMIFMSTNFPFSAKTKIRGRTWGTPSQYYFHDHFSLIGRQHL